MIQFLNINFKKNQISRAVIFLGYFTSEQVTKINLKKMNKNKK